MAGTKHTYSRGSNRPGGGAIIMTERYARSLDEALAALIPHRKRAPNVKRQVRMPAFSFQK